MQNLSTTLYPYMNKQMKTLIFKICLLYANMLKVVILVDMNVFISFSSPNNSNQPNKSHSQQKNQIGGSKSNLNEKYQK